MRAVILGCEGPHLGPDERRFFAEADPVGFILFRRNFVDPAQARQLTDDLRACVGRDAPILVDQEGGRVIRLGAPHWYEAPAPAVFGELHGRDPAMARRAVRANAALIGLDLASVGVDVNCVPSLDVRQPGGHRVIGDRALSTDPDVVADLGRAVCEGTRSAGVLPVIKHLPGHGRTAVDSHDDLPRVVAPRDALSRVDFAPFRALRDEPMGMTGHLLFTAVDADRPTTLSPTVIDTVIRGEIGFDGLLLTDDISMQALAGTVGERARKSLAAGCDLVLHCNGDRSEMEDVVSRTGTVTGATLARVERALRARDDVRARASAEREALRRDLGRLLPELARA